MFRIRAGDYDEPSAKCTHMKSPLFPVTLAFCIGILAGVYVRKAAQWDKDAAAIIKK